MSREILARWPGEKLSGAEAESVWTELREFGWAHPGGPLIKVALTPVLLPALDQALRTDAQAAGLDESLRKLDLRGVALRGNVPLWLGAHRHPTIAEAVKKALDP